MGEIDIRSRLLRQLGKDIDFSVGSISSSSWLNAVDRDKFISVQIVKKLIRDTFTPLIKALVALNKQGFHRTYLHCIPPPTLNDEKFEEINEYSYPRRLHYKIVYLINNFLRDECCRLHVKFIDIWNKVTLDDSLLDEYCLDHTHLNDHACRHTVEFILEDMFNKPDPKALDQQYIDLYSSSKKEFQDSSKAERYFKKSSFTKFASQSLALAPGVVDAKLVSNIMNSLKFEKEIDYFMPVYDWVGGRGKSADVHNKTSDFSQESLKLIFEALYCDKSYSIISSMLGCNFVTFVRGRKSCPHETEATGSQSFHRDGNPAGLFRGILYLSDVTEESGPFEIQLNPDKNVVTKVIGPAGSLLVFDAQRYLHRGSPPQKQIRYALDLVFVPCSVKTQPFVVHQCQNSWPYDPYKFDISKFPSWPVTNDNFINLSKPVNFIADQHHTAN